MVSRVVFSSDKTDWGTPDGLFRALHAEFHFTVDGAASPQNALLPRFFCEPHWYRSQPLIDGLESSWAGERVWCNPPYGRGVGDWIAKGAKFEADVSVFLIPSRTDTLYWHRHIWDMKRHRPRPGVQVRFLKGRLKFKGASAGAPFPSAVVFFSRFLRESSTASISHLGSRNG